MKGYYNDPEATAHALRGGYFHSGDAAVVHPDGYVEIRDRLKDVIISGGENISSVEVEGRAAAPSRGAGSGGRRHARRQVGRGAARVCRAEGGRDGAPPTSCGRSRATTWRTSSVPHSFTFVTELPKTATGKIQKFVLRGGVRRSPLSDGTRQSPVVSRQSRVVSHESQSSVAVISRQGFSRPSSVDVLTTRLTTDTHDYTFFEGLLSQRKNRTIITAGMNGPHHASGRRRSA